MSNKYLCGTPDQHCLGSKTLTNAMLRMHVSKTHPTSETAFKCYAHYLVTVRGYEQIGSREFQKNNEPVLVLSKKSHFGAKLRRGKEGQRYEPKRGSGVII